MLKSNWRDDEPATAAECWRRVKDVRARLHPKPVRPAVTPDFIPNAHSSPSGEKAIPLQRWVNAADVAKRIQEVQQGDDLRMEIANKIASNEIKSIFDLPPEQQILVRPGDRARMIMLQVCEKFYFTPTDMFSERRPAPLVIARQELMYRLRTETTWSLPRIGRFLNRDHTTILYGVRAHCQRHNLPEPGTRGSVLKEVEVQALEYALNQALGTAA